MSQEAALWMLAAAILWGLVQLFWSSTMARRQQGFDWGVGPRDEPRPLHGQAARLDRAYRNYLETFPLYAALLLAALAVDKLGALTAWGAGLYLAGRLAYTPLYAIGVPVLRTVVWLIAIAGLLLMLVALLA